MKALPAPDPQRKTRRQFRRMLLPLLLFGLLLMIVALGLMVILPHPEAQLSITGDVIIMTLVMCPLTICSAGLFIAMAASIFFMNKAHSGIEKGLQQVRQGANTVTERAASLSATAGEKSIQLNARTAPLDTFWERRASANKLESGQDQ